MRILEAYERKRFSGPRIEVNPTAWGCLTGIGHFLINSEIYYKPIIVCANSVRCVEFKEINPK